MPLCTLDKAHAMLHRGRGYGLPWMAVQWPLERWRMPE